MRIIVKLFLISIIATINASNTLIGNTKKIDSLFNK